MLFADIGGSMKPETAPGCGIKLYLHHTCVRSSVLFTVVLTRVAALAALAHRTGFYGQFHSKKSEGLKLDAYPFMRQLLHECLKLKIADGS